MDQHRHPIPGNPHINLNPIYTQHPGPQNPRNTILSLMPRTSPMRNN